MNTPLTNDHELELIACKRAMADGDEENAQRHWEQYITLLFKKMSESGQPVSWAPPKERKCYAEHRINGKEVGSVARDKGSNTVGE